MARNKVNCYLDVVIRHTDWTPEKREEEEKREREESEKLKEWPKM